MNNCYYAQDNPEFSFHHFLSPHPDPLPQGERVSKLFSLPQGERATNLFPLPRGERIKVRGSFIKP